MPHRQKLTAQTWIDQFESQPIPILGRTRERLRELLAKDTDITAQQFAALISHDALLSSQVVRYLQANRSRQQTTDVATVERVVLMVGITPLLKHFQDVPSLEEVLQGNLHGLQYARSVMFRSRMAALCAASWAAFRHDLDEQEVVTAALLRDIGEVLMSVFAPKHILRIRAMQQQDPRLRSNIAQKAVFGFPLLELQLALIERWQLPASLKMLMDESHAEHPRVRTVTTAVAYARHAMVSWDNAALADDYKAIEAITGLGADKAEQVTLHAVVKAFDDWSWYADGDPAIAPYCPIKTVI